MTHKITLYVDADFVSPYALSVFVALKEKRLDFSIVTVDLGSREQLQSAYRARSLTCRVPTLECDGFAVSESSAAIEYLEELFPAPQNASVYPREIASRARTRQVQAWLRSDLPALRMERPTTVMFFQPNTEPLSDRARADSLKLFDIASVLLERNSENLFGAWTIADTELSLMLNRLVLNGDKVPERLENYARLQWQRQSVQAWIAQNRRNKI